MKLTLPLCKFCAISIISDGFYKFKKTIWAILYKYGKILCKNGKPN